jgi:hypothetical protein
VGASAPVLLGIAHAEEALPRGLEMQVPGKLARLFPLLDVGEDLPASELGPEVRCFLAVV